MWMLLVYEEYFYKEVRFQTRKCLLVIEFGLKLQTVGCENGLPHYKNHPETFRKIRGCKGKHYFSDACSNLKNILISDDSKCKKSFDF